MMYMYRESSRNIDLLTGALIPKARQSVEVARTGYASGRVAFIDLLGAEQTLLGFELAEIQARTQRELALAALSLSIAGTPPEGAPVLPGSSSAPARGRSATEVHP